jgi:lipopolysaccharide transport system ATP-binding protein
VEKFLNTPVKRYSSGMTVRLAFAVAAHLEPEILIIDEVLAVGDAAFQKKCIGKMKDVARDGRTVLFVSHNMAAVSNLCKTALLMQDGQLIQSGNTDDVIGYYLSSIGDNASISLSERRDRKGSGEIKIQSVDYLNEQGKIIKHPLSGSVLVIRLNYRTYSENEFRNCRVSVTIMKDQRPLILLHNDVVSKDEVVLSGSGYIDFIIPELPLSKGNYHISTYIESNNEIIDWVDTAAEMPVMDGDFYGSGKCYPSTAWAGKTVLVKHNLRIVRNT